jgi:methionyl-tRNA synthetase
MTRAPRTVYHTTPIYYVNDVPHPGHAYSTVATDALTRARRLQGDDAFFLTGTDEHGQNIERIARERGKPVQQYCDEIAARFAALWERLEIRYDRFIRTTDDLHKRGVLKLWAALRDAKTPSGEPAIYKSTYAGWYCPRCEAFKTDGELIPPDNLCVDHERPCEAMEEENLFFRLSGFEDWLREQIESGALLLEPTGRRNEVLAVLRQGLQDFSISRARVKWGIPVPDEPGHVFYVWMDALANYITALGFADSEAPYEKYWAGSGERFHMIGKEIIRFHCLYWPAMLHAAGLPIPTRIFAHGWMTKGGKKLSKTTGNIIDPDALLDRYGADPVRYFFLREGAFGQDWDFTEGAFEKRYNSDLANDLGNLVSRALTMAARYGEGRTPPRPERPGVPQGIEERLSLEAERTALLAKVFERYEALDFSGALSELWAWVAELNQRIVIKQPWALAKDPQQRSELDAFLYRLLEAIRIISVLVSPVMPNAQRRIDVMLGASAMSLAEALEWGGLQPGQMLGKVEALFPRIEAEPADTKKSNKKKEAPVSDIDKEGQPADQDAAPRPADQAPARAAAVEKSPPVKPDPTIDISEFARVELRVAEIKSAERVPKSKKLLRIEVIVGEETRQVVAGIAEAYDPETLPGKRVILVANLKPAKLMGVESNGMLLAATLDGRPVLLTPEVEVPSGTLVR